MYNFGFYYSCKYVRIWWHVQNRKCVRQFVLKTDFSLTRTRILKTNFQKLEYFLRGFGVGSRAVWQQYQIVITFSSELELLPANSRLESRQHPGECSGGVEQLLNVDQVYISLPESVLGLTPYWDP